MTENPKRIIKKMRLSHLTLRAGERRSWLDGHRSAPLYENVLADYKQIEKEIETLNAELMADVVELIEV